MACLDSYETAKLFPITVTPIYIPISSILVTNCFVVSLEFCIVFNIEIKKGILNVFFMCLFGKIIIPMFY